MTSDLDRAESIRLKFGAEFERQRFELIKRMEAGVFRTPSQVKRYHELVCFARACSLIVSLGSVPGWSQHDKTALRAVLLAKGGQEQSRYVHLFDRHRHLREALLKLSRRGLQKLE